MLRLGFRVDGFGFILEGFFRMFWSKIGLGALWVDFGRFLGVQAFGGTFLRGPRGPKMAPSRAQGDPKMAKRGARETKSKSLGSHFDQK